MQKFVLYN